jgi:hypothetical protein
VILGGTVTSPPLVIGGSFTVSGAGEASVTDTVKLGSLKLGVKLDDKLGVKLDERLIPSMEFDLSLLGLTGAGDLAATSSSSCCTLFMRAAFIAEPIIILSRSSDAFCASLRSLARLPECFLTSLRSLRTLLSLALLDILWTSSPPLNVRELERGLAGISSSDLALRTLRGEDLKPGVNVLALLGLVGESSSAGTIGANLADAECDLPTPLIG